MVNNPLMKNLINIYFYFAFVFTAFFGYFLSVQANFIDDAYPKFVDMKNHWAEPYLNILQRNKVILPRSQSLFYPDIDITRAGFVQIAIQARYSSNEIESCISHYAETTWDWIFFPDISRFDSFAPYICLAKINNIINGYKDGNFYPDQTITRAEALKIIFTLESGYKIDPCPKNFVRDSWNYVFYTDVKKDSWYAPYVCKAHINEFVQGYEDGNFYPNENVTNAEAIKIIVEILQFYLK